jgi:HSP20 family protein
VHPRSIFREDFFEDLFSNPIGTLAASAYSLDMYETDDHVIVELEAPNFNPEDVEISIENETLVVSGTVEKEEKEEDQKKKYYYQEINRSAFKRAVKLPVRVKPEEAEATFVNGIIKIAMPKAEDVKPQKVTVKTK